MSRPTLADIAREAGVSATTVSRVLRGQDNVSASTQRAVLIAVQALGLGVPVPAGNANPTVAAQGSPVEGRRPIIAVLNNQLVGSDADPYGTLALALNRRIFSEGAIALNMVAEATPTSVRVDAVIALGGGSVADRAQMFHARGTPTISIAPAPDPELSQFILDAAVGIQAAVRHLIQLGHRRIGLAVAENFAADERIRAFRAALADTLHIAATRDQAPVAVTGVGMLAGAQAADELLEARCTAAISCAPAITFGFLEAVRRVGLRIPDDLSLLTVGDMTDADVLDPPMSQVTYNWSELAESAVAQVLRPRGSSTVRARFRAVPELVLRSSVMPVTRR